MREGLPRGCLILLMRDCIVTSPSSYGDSGRHATAEGHFTTAQACRMIDALSSLQEPRFSMVLLARDTTRYSNMIHIPIVEHAPLPPAALSSRFLSPSSVWYRHCASSFSNYCYELKPNTNLCVSRDIYHSGTTTYHMPSAGVFSSNLRFEDGSLSYETPRGAHYHPPNE